MRKIYDHKVNGLNEAIEINVMDNPGPGGANHKYKIVGPMVDGGQGIGPMPKFGVDLKFQNGPIQSQDDMNGISNEALIAVVIDRMQGFQSGQFACRENALALTKLEEAMMWLQKRTRDRMARGVEGTLQK